MATLDGTFDLSTLDVENLTLDMIPDFTEVEARQLIVLKQGLEEANTDEKHKQISDEIDKLQFLRTADTNRDMALDDRFPEFDKKHAITALQDYARVLQKKY